MRKIPFLPVFIILSLLGYSRSENERRMESIERENLIHIKVYFDPRYSGDTLSIELWPIASLVEPFAGYWSFKNPYQHHLIIINDKGVADFKSNKITQPMYLSLGKDKRILSNPEEYLHFLRLALVSPGDSLIINVWTDSIYKPLIHKSSEWFNRKYVLDFKGKGADKLTCKYFIDHRAPGFSSTPPSIQGCHFNEDNQAKRHYESKLSILNSFRNKLNAYEYATLKANMLGDYLDLLCTLVLGPSFSKVDLNKLENSDILEHHLDSLLKELPDTAIASSNTLFLGIYLIEKTSFLLKNKIISENFYYRLKSRYKGILRDKLLLKYCVSNYNLIEHYENIAEDACATLIEKNYIKFVDSLKRYSKGLAAYDFSLTDRDGRKVALTDFKGKVIFVDFWYTGCSNCAEFYINVLSKVEKTFANNAKIAFISISIDRDKNKWNNSIIGKVGQKYTSPYVINLYTEGLGSNHPVIKNYNVVGYPSALLIDKNGKIFSRNDNELRNIDGLTNAINKALTKN